jgi:hypothetical protein
MMIRKAVLLLFSLLLILALFEIGVRITNLDMIAIKPLLYYQWVDQEVHRVSDNAEKLYELNPKTSHTYNKRVVSINDFGYRDKERKKIKGNGVFRIICLGGSNTYGAAVNDNETYPYYLEELLNKRSDKKFEVWNAGCSAYVLSQDVEEAKHVISEYSPDLLIFQDTNSSRRAFLRSQNYNTFFRKNKALYFDNLKFIPFNTTKTGKLLLESSYAYRLAVILLNNLVCIPQNNKVFDNNKLISVDKFIAFYNEINPKIQIVVWGLKSGFESDLCFDKDGKELNHINIFQKKYYPKDIDIEYFEIHPPSYVYKWYAETMLKELVDKKYIKI